MAFQSKVTHHFMITATRERIHCLSPGICWGVADQGPVPGAESRVSRADTTGLLGASGTVPTRCT